MPPKPMAPASRVSHTCGMREGTQLAAPGRVLVARAATARSAATSASVTTPSAATAQNAERQPRCWPIQVAAGTPTTLATLSPSITEATARPLRAGLRQARGDQRGDAEVGAVRQPGGEAGQHQPAVRRRERAHRVADGERDHQRHQQRRAAAAGRRGRPAPGRRRRRRGRRRRSRGRRSGSRRRRRRRSAAAAPSSRTRWCRSRSRPSPARGRRARSARAPDGGVGSTGGSAVVVVMGGTSPGPERG